MMKTALITGASSGIGQEFAKLLHAEGYKLVLVARNRSRLEEFAKQLDPEGKAGIRIVPKDLSAISAAAELGAELSTVGVEIDLLVNNAGFGMWGPFVEMAAEREIEMVQLNVVSVTTLTKEFLPGMVKRGRGGVLNVASTAAFQPGPLMAVYYASKAYVLSFSEALANEVKGTGVHVTALCPGPVETGFQKAAKMEDSKLVASGQVKMMDARTVAVAGYRGLLAGKAIVIPGFQNRLMANSIRFLPRGLVTTVVRKAQERTH